MRIIVVATFAAAAFTVLSILYLRCTGNKL